jgi:hypothetical protein
MQLKEKTLELELADLKIKQHQAKAAQEHAQMVLYAEQVSQLVSTEKTLRVQLAADGEKFQQFQVLKQKDPSLSSLIPSLQCILSDGFPPLDEHVI